jgi:hypothetical protein
VRTDCEERFELAPVPLWLENHSALAERVRSMIELNNQYDPGAVLSLAMGCATAHKGDRLEATVSRADERMFEDKRDFYARAGIDRRTTRPASLD